MTLDMFNKLDKKPTEEDLDYFNFTDLFVLLELILNEK